MKSNEALRDKCETNLNNTPTYTFMNLTNKDVFLIFAGVGLSYQLDFVLPILGIPFHMLIGLTATVVVVVVFKKWRYSKPRGWVEGELYRMGIQRFKGLSLLPPASEKAFMFFQGVEND